MFEAYRQNNLTSESLWVVYCSLEFVGVPFLEPPPQTLKNHKLWCMWGSVPGSPALPGDCRRVQGDPSGMSPMREETRCFCFLPLGGERRRHPSPACKPASPEKRIWRGGVTYLEGVDEGEDSGVHKGPLEYGAPQHESPTHLDIPSRSAAVQVEKSPQKSGPTNLELRICGGSL